MNYDRLCHELNLGAIQTPTFVSYAVRELPFCGASIAAREYLPGTEVAMKLDGPTLLAIGTLVDVFGLGVSELDFAQNCHGFTFEDELGGKYWINEIHVENLLHPDSPYKEATPQSASVVLLLQGTQVIHSARTCANGFESKVGCRQVHLCRDLEEFRTSLDYRFDTAKYFQRAY